MADKQNGGFRQFEKFFLNISKFEKKFHKYNLKINEKIRQEFNKNLKTIPRLLKLPETQNELEY
jgi:hypothetical protein